MKDQYKLQRVPAAPEYRNSAGRLLRLLEMLRSQNAYVETVATFYEDQRGSITNETKGYLYLQFMRLLTSAYEEFVNDIEATDTIPEATKKVLQDGLSNLRQMVYPINMGNAPRPLQDSDIALLRMASSMLPEETALRKEDADTISESIERLKDTVNQSDLPKSVRNALLEIVRLSRNALDQFNIHGARGFKAAFKRMLSELMEIYLDQGPDTVKDKSWWKQALEHVKLVDNVAGRLLKYKPLLDSFGRIFLGPGSA